MTIITGVPREANDPTGPCPTRKDIDDWYLQQTGQDGNRIQLTLFVEALTKMQSTEYRKDLSYFGLASIHGAPGRSWDGVENDSGKFCVHGNYTFPTWHRVYLALFEQVIHKTMICHIKDLELAESLNDEWMREANNWRLPYWDFARFPAHSQGNELRLPILATIPMVKVTEPGVIGKTTSKANPLYRFQMEIPMGELDDGYKIASIPSNEFTIPFDKCQSTTRYGLLDGYNADVWADGGQNWLRVNLALNEHPWNVDMRDKDAIPTLQDMTYRLLTTSTSWGNFASTRNSSSREQQPHKWLSLEGIHNNVHNWVGGYTFRRPEKELLTLWGVGHMAYNSVAAFDPIFWLHHCNIDRLTAIWQSLNDEKWFNDGQSDRYLEDDLKPFHKADNVFFKSDDHVRYWRNFNYDYEITQTPGNDVRRVRARAEIDTDIKRLYGPKSAQVYENRNDYVLNIKYKRHALNDGDPFQINVFFGRVDGKDFYDSRSKNFVGSVFNFSTSTKLSKCGNCTEQQEDDTWSVSQIPATLAVYNYREEHKGNPTPQYVVVNSLGKAVKMEDKVEVTLHEAELEVGDPPGGGHNGKYKKVADGEPAEVDKGYRAKDMDRPASSSSSSSSSTSPLIMVVHDDEY